MLFIFFEPDLMFKLQQQVVQKQKDNIMAWL